MVCLRNVRRLGVLNGTRGTVVGLERPTAHNRHRRTAWSTCRRKYIEAGHLDHGYATTVHKAQGATYEQAFVLATDRLYRESGYVAMSRARGGAELFVAAGPFEDGRTPDVVSDEPLAATVNRLATSRAKRLASESLASEHPSGVDPPVVQLLGWTGRHGKAVPEMPRAVDRMATDFSGPAQPPWITVALGRRPAFVDEQARYDEIAAAITHYRRHYSIQGDDPLGERPFEARSRLAYDAVAEEIRSYDRRRGRELAAPSLDNGLSSVRRRKNKRHVSLPHRLDAWSPKGHRAGRGGAATWATTPTPCQRAAVSPSPRCSPGPRRRR